MMRGGAEWVACTGGHTLESISNCSRRAGRGGGGAAAAAARGLLTTGDGLGWKRVCLRNGGRISDESKVKCIRNRVVLSGRSWIRSVLHLENGGVLEEKPVPYDSELRGFAERVVACNGGRTRSSEFLPFKIEKQILGHIHHRFAQHLQRFSKVFLIEGEEESIRTIGKYSTSKHVTLAPGLSTPEKRTEAVGEVLEILKGEGLINGWRSELYPVVRSYGESPFLLIERAAAKHFGIRAYGVHMNGYVIIDGEKHLWVARRSETKSTYAGMLDHIVAGGQPEGISCKENVIKECDEEAAIPRELAEKAVAVGAVSYDEIYGDCYSRDLLFCYDLELPLDFQPYNKDGEVQSFMRVPVSEVFSVIRDTEQYKPNCALVIIDFLIRHGYITPEHKGYVHLLQSLRSIDTL